MRFIFLIILISILTGCVTTQPTTEKVLVPVPTKCYNKPLPTKPELNVDKMTGKEKTDVILNGALQDVNKLEVYSDTLLTYICK